MSINGIGCISVMVFKDSISGQILYKQYVKTETNKLYLAGVEEIAKRGIKYNPLSAMDVRGCCNCLQEF